MENLCLGCMTENVGATACPHCGWQAGTDPESPLYLVPGTVLKEQYVVGRVLGHGGFGITYIGWDLNLTRRIAIKEYFPGGVAVRTVSKPEVFPYSQHLRGEYTWGLERYLEEARVVARFENHPNIIWVQNYFQANGTAYIILEYLDGRTFEKFIDERGGKVDWQTAMRVMMHVMDALREVHRVGLMHRDISPDNIFMLNNRQVKVIDFGAARYAMGQHSRNLSVILKQGYAPPEQYQTKGEQGPWTDIYATAATLYRAVTGTVPPTAPDRQFKDELAPPSKLGFPVPAAKEQALLRALALRPEERFQDMPSFQAALLGESAEPPLPAPAPIVTPPPDLPPTPAPKPIPSPGPKAKLSWILAAAAVAASLAIGAVIVKSTEKPLRIEYFRAEPAKTQAGQPVTLSWSVANATDVQIEGLGRQPLSGTLTIRPGRSSSYVLRAERGTHDAQLRANVTIDEPPPPAPDPSPTNDRPPDPKPVIHSNTDVQPKPAAPVEIARFEFVPATVREGQPTELIWSVRGATQVLIDPGRRPVQPEGRSTLTPKTSATVRMTAQGPAGSTASSATVTVLPADRPQPAPPLRITQFYANPTSVPAGQPVQLHWQVEGAAAVQIAPDVGVLQVPSGQTTVVPRQTTRYVLTATSARGQRQANSVDVVVQSPPAPRPAGTSWSVLHDHSGFPKIDLNLGRARNNTSPRTGEWESCQGDLVLTSQTLRFDSRTSNDGFETPLSAIKEVKTNRLAIRGYRAFHVELRNGRNYNFVPRTNVDGIVLAIQQAAR